MAAVLFIAAHPDDETLGMGVAIAEHVAAGHDVHVLILSRSPGSVVLPQLNGTGVSPWWGLVHDPAAEGYTPLDATTFGQARYDEMRRALDCLQTGLGTITLHEAGLSGGSTSAQVQAAIVTAADLINPGGAVWLKGHSPIVDDHPDHVVCGQAIAALAASTPARFATPRFYILPRYWADPRLSAVTEHWDHPTDAGIAARAVNACRAYGAWAPPASYAIGWHSVYIDMFAPLLANPKCMYHA